jgi:hypothetical protein
VRACFAVTVIWIGVVFVAAVLILVLITSAWPARAHDWYDRQCCGDNDCRPVPCEQISAQNGGFEYRDARDRATYFFTRDKMKPSFDENCHVCLHAVNSWDSHHDQSVKTSPICVYLPVRM